MPPAAAQAAWPGPVQAARSGWQDAHAPDVGWETVTLPHDWNQQWPGHDGVVWYRLRWRIEGPPQPLGLYIHYLMHAGTVSVNGVPLQRDDSLVEPLSRTWNLPRYLLLPAPLLRPGDNEVLIRVSGYHAYQPALGTVEIGEPQKMLAAQRQSYLARQSLQWLNLGIGATLGCFFLALWMMRRQETAYGWYGLQQVAWLAFSVNFVNPGTWPFNTTDGYAAATSAAYVLYHGCNAMFVLRFMDCRWPRRERAMWLLVAVACVAMLLAPHQHILWMRQALAWFSSALMATTAGVFLYLAWRVGNPAQRLLSLAALAKLLALAHDLLVFLRIVDSNFYLVTYTETLSTFGIALGLAWTFVSSTRRIENFNEEMRRSVADARAELAALLARQHELELAHARVGERISLAHDLHDGLGGMLLGNIHTVERSNQPVPAGEVLDMLRGMRDDLRLIIDTAAAQQYGELSLAELIAPLRHRMSRLFELHGIDLQWVVELDGAKLDTTQSLELLRILQEALTNAFRHSGASQVQVLLDGRHGPLQLRVRDNGTGIGEKRPAGGGAGSPGTGLRSMHERARRLGATLVVESGATATEVRMAMPGGAPAPLSPGES